MTTSRSASIELGPESSEPDSPAYSPDSPWNSPPRSPSYSDYSPPSPVHNPESPQRLPASPVRRAIEHQSRRRQQSVVHQTPGSWSPAPNDSPNNVEIRRNSQQQSRHCSTCCCFDDTDPGTQIDADGSPCANDQQNGQRPRRRARANNGASIILAQCPTCALLVSVDHLREHQRTHERQNRR